MRYGRGHRAVAVLNGIDLSVSPGEFIAIVGPSGSGKTTLLGLLAGLDVPSQGVVKVEGHDLASLTEDQRAEFRVRRMGFVFQTFQLISSLTALENVMVPLELQGETGERPRRRARELMSRVGLADRMDHYPAQLSGGEQQRVGLARAFSSDPAILLADEPTGNLDDETGSHVASLLQTLNRERGTTLVLVTHDLSLAERADRIVRLRGGTLAPEAGEGGGD